MAHVNSAHRFHPQTSQSEETIYPAALSERNDPHYLLSQQPYYLLSFSYEKCPWNIDSVWKTALEIEMLSLKRLRFIQRKFRSLTFVSNKNLHHKICVIDPCYTLLALQKEMNCIEPDTYSILNTHVEYCCIFLFFSLNH